MEEISEMGRKGETIKGEDFAKEIIAKEMKPYIDLQKAIAKLIEGIEKAIKEQ